MCEMYSCPVNYNIDSDKDDQSLWDSQESMEDKIILETEITLKTGPNITMQIHEESRTNSGTSHEGEQNSNKTQAILRIFEDSESDFDEYRNTPRSPRKVRFGGESVKLRTPESDSSHQTEDEINQVSSIKITVTDAMSIKTKRSLIPVRVSSLPSTPKKSLSFQESGTRKYKSVPDLAMGSSKIPLRKKAMQRQMSIHSKIGGNLVEDAPAIKTSSDLKDRSDNLRHEGHLRPSILKHNKAEGTISPIPVHNEVEILYNLTRSPERSRRNSAVSDLNSEQKNEVRDLKPSEETQNLRNSDESRNFESFSVFDKDNTRLVPKLSPPETEGKKLVVPIPTNKELFLQQSLSSLTSDDEVLAKSEALESLVKMLKESGTCESLEAAPAALLFEALFACHHRDCLHSLADDALIIMIEGLRLEFLEKCLQRLALSLCKMGGSSGVRCALAVMKKLPPKKLQVEILCRAFGHRTREGALQILMSSARLYPRQDVEVAKIAEFAALALRDRRRKVKQAALETLAVTAQLSSVHEVLIIVEANIKNFGDFEDVMQVIRTRLSRKQLPTVNLDGTIRYSTPTDQTESDWISGTISKNANVSPSPSSSASSSNASANYWAHNMRHAQQFNAGSTFIRQLSESFEDDAFDGAAKEWTTGTATYCNNGKMAKPSKNGVLRPVYILQPDASPIQNGKSSRGYRKYDRGRSFSPPKHLRGQYPPASVEPISAYNSFNGNSLNAVNNNHSGTLESHARLQYPEFHTGIVHPPGFRKSLSSDQLYFNDRLSLKQEQYSHSLSSRSSSTSTGSSSRSGFWQRSAIPIPIAEQKLKIRHSSGSLLSTSGPLIAKRSILPTSHQTPSSSKSSPRHPSAQDNDSVTRLTLPASRSSGSDSSGYFTPSPPENHPPAFIKMDTEERLSSDIEESLSPSVNNNSQDCVDSHSSKSVSDGGCEGKENSNSTSLGIEEQNHYLGEAIHDNYPSVESIHLNNNQETEERPYSRASALDSAGTTVEIRRKSKSVIEFQNFLPKIGSRKIINSAPHKNEDEINNHHSGDMSPPSEPLDNQFLSTTSVTVRKTKLERRFCRTDSRKSVKASPRTQAVTESVHVRSAHKTKDVLPHILSQIDNPNWEITVDGLQGLAKLARENPDVVEHQLHQVCVSVAKQIKNLRSQVARIACNIAGELFMSCKHGLDMELDEIASPLLQRTADTNRFLRADANAALDIMCEHLPIHRVIPVITSRGCSHQNPIVRATSVRLLGDIVRRLGPDRTLVLPKDLRDKVMLCGANSLADGNLDARSHGKSLFKCLIGHSHFQRCLYDAVPQNILRHISKVLASIKPDI
ncbi:TOG array regulator of axonemal microtubules protein 1 isoform X1 [Euwallacea fornicatus]|uniref:TOG array regulator of axonemal microtubules protein 1 isoform X1 n=1 Tax=Euwallacea fornicatus TaxID=995702 RepID=UPI0033902693